MILSSIIEHSTMEHSHDEIEVNAEKTKYIHVHIS